MQQLAAHKAALSQCGVENEPSFQRMVLAQLQNTGAQLQTLDARLVLQTCWEPNAWETFVSCDVNQAAASTENVFMELVIIGGCGICAFIIGNPKQVIMATRGGLGAIIKGPK